jgi:hypothetical protein
VIPGTHDPGPPDAPRDPPRRDPRDAQAADALARELGLRSDTPSPAPGLPTLDEIDLASADAVVEALEAGARAGRSASCRRGSIDSIGAPGRLVATGDLHDNPVHFEAIVRAAGLGALLGRDSDAGAQGEAPPISHVTLHEVIHSDRLISGMDFSYRVLTRVALLKAHAPEFVHVLLGNHELAQITGAGIIKDGVRSVDAFNAGVEHVFGGESTRVHDAIGTFVRSMPLALRCQTPRGDILASHSLPAAPLMSRFDPGVLSRELEESDYEPRRGAAHIMVWGRGYDAELLEDLVERWGVYLFILGHEKVPDGATFTPPNALVLNSDHARGAYAVIDLSNPPRADDALSTVVRLG